MIDDAMLNRRTLIAPKLRTIYANDLISSSDSNGSIRKTLLNKSTMTTAEKDANVNRYETWNNNNKSPVSCPMISTNNFNIYNDDKFHTESLLKQKMCSSKKYNHTTLPSSNHSIEKPKVFTYDDRNLLNQQQNILSSSSGSSTFSFKDKNIKEAGETR
jgi:hypothetical protein